MLSLQCPVLLICTSPLHLLLPVAQLFVAVPAEISSAKIPLKDSFLMKVKQGMRKGTDLHAGMHIITG